MQSAPTPSNEKARLEALRSFNVLDTLPETAYDDITLIASQICTTPIALVSLVDTDRQWFKSKVGIDAEETPRDVAFCAHAILEPEELFVVENALEDERFADNPLVADAPSIRFYAGAPLVTSAGEALGTLCVIDRIPRELDEEQSATLRALARQVMAQLELRRSVEELNEAHSALEHVNGELAQSNRDLERFAYVAAHDLKEPLRMISSFSELLGESIAGKLSEDEAEFLAYIRDGANRGQRLTSEILQYSKLDQESERDWVDLDDLLRAESEAALQTYEQGRVVWEETGVKLWSNAGLLSHLLHNLITNALKYNEQDQPTVYVKVEADGEGVEISLRDNGIGIQSDQLGNVFDMFFRAHGKSQYEGTGIGLAICRRIMELHGGDIRVESEVGKGSHFICTFPPQASSEVVDGRHHNIAG